MTDSSFIHIIQHYQLLWVSAIHSSGYKYIQLLKGVLKPYIWPSHLLPKLCW